MKAVPESTRRWTRAWLALCLALALHVVDEAATGFLSVWNPLVRDIRERLPGVPLPTFSFGAWLGRLIAAVVLLTSLTWWVRRGARWMVAISYMFAVIMFGNGLLHVTGSLYRRDALPGLYSAPLLLIAAVYLFMATRRYQLGPKG